MIGDRRRNNLVSGRYRLGAYRFQQIGPQIQFSPYHFSTSVQGSQLGPRYATFGPSIGFSIKDLNCLPFPPSLFACQERDDLEIRSLRRSGNCRCLCGVLPCIRCRYIPYVHSEDVWSKGCGKCVCMLRVGEKQGVELALQKEEHEDEEGRSGVTSNRNSFF
jgi:hypothetical protein